MAELLYESISSELIKQIQTGVLEEGARLSERSLAEKYGVSRTVVRDALKLLHEKGYMYIKTGKGHFVKYPNEDDFNEKLSSIIENGAIPIDDIIEARVLIENSMADMVIERANDSDVAELQLIYSNMNDVLSNPGLYTELDRKFHIRLMKCAGNNMLSFFIKALNATTDRTYLMWDETSRMLAHQQHAMMIQAVKERNKDLLLQALNDHIDCIKKHYTPNKL